MSELFYAPGGFRWAVRGRGGALEAGVRWDGASAGGNGDERGTGEGRRWGGWGMHMHVVLIKREVS